MACIDRFDHPKDPDETLDYSIDWSARLDEGDSISSSTWIISPTGLVQESAAFNGALTTIWVSGGEMGKTYTLTNRIQTSAGRIRDLSYGLRIDQK